MCMSFLSWIRPSKHSIRFQKDIGYFLNGGCFLDKEGTQEISLNLFLCTPQGKSLCEAYILFAYQNINFRDAFSHKTWNLFHSCCQVPLNTRYSELQILSVIHSLPLSKFNIHFRKANKWALSMNIWHPLQVSSWKILWKNFWTFGLFYATEQNRNYTVPKSSKEKDGKWCPSN